MKPLFVILILCSSAHAGILDIEVPGNDNAERVSHIVGTQVVEVARFEYHDGPAFGILPFEHDYDFFTVKAGNAFNIYAPDPPETEWVTPFGKALSHITLYRIVPEPEIGVLLLMLLLLISPVLLAKR